MLLVLPLFGRTIEVCPNCDISSIKQGIEAASECDTIIVKGGIYTEGNIIINKSLHLIGLNYPILDGQNETEILTITADHVTVDGFQIQNVGLN